MLAISGILFLRSKKTILHYPVFFLRYFYHIRSHRFCSFRNKCSDRRRQYARRYGGDSKSTDGNCSRNFSGRVVWVHNTNAVNQNCNPSLLNHAWWAAENNNQSSIDSMVSMAIDSLTGQKTDSAAWVALFKYNNAARGKGSVGYNSGEKIFIKINECSAWSGNITDSLTKVNGGWLGMSETSPAMALSILHQLVDIVHVPQNCIYIGDPIRNIYKEWYTQWYPKYPNVHYLGHDSYPKYGREAGSCGPTALIHYSDRGTNFTSPC